MRVLSVLSLLLMSHVAQAQAPRDYYLYQRAAVPSPLHVDAEFATGTRDAGAFGHRGIEGLVRAGWTLNDRWTLEGTFGAVEDHDADERAVGWSVEGRYGLSPDDLGWAVALGAGYRRDYAGVSIPFVRLIGERAMERWNLAVSGLVEVPQEDEDDPEEGERDAADVIASLGTSYAVSQSVRLGVELAAEDIEGFFDDEEAEGGAKLILGPTMNWRVGDAQLVRAHVGWIYAATANEPTNPGSADYRANRHGVLARVALGFGR